MKKNNFKFNKRFTYLIVAFVFIFIVGSIAGVYAYYIYNKQLGGHVESTNFYFDSDYLVEGGKTYNLNVGTNSLTFELRNFPDQLRYSENDIEYKVTITNNGKVSLDNGTDLNNDDSIIVSSLVGGEKRSHKITITGLENGNEYTVSVVGSNGYVKTLSATFKVRDTLDTIYQNVTESDPYVILTIWTENISGEATISFPVGLIPDNTCSGLENVLTNSGYFTINCEAYSSYEFRFFKTDSYDESSSFDVYLKVFENKTVTAVRK